MLTVAKIDRYDLVNNPGDDGPCTTVWFSGCAIKCPGCQNPSLHEPGGKQYAADTLFNEIDGYCLPRSIHTVVLLGGEPMDQDRKKLLRLCKTLYTGRYRIWMYTGYEFEHIPPMLLQYLYTVKCGPYVEGLSTGGFPASSNQRVMRMINHIWQPITIGGDNQ